MDQTFEVIWEVPEELERCMVIRMILQPLVENAIKYNKIDGEGWVHVSLNADHQYFYIKVEDSGIGIPAEDLDHIFERFYRVDKARSRKSGGSGLGLSIVRNMVERNNGKILVNSTEGMGTTFTVTFPVFDMEDNA